MNTALNRQGHSKHQIYNPNIVTPRYIIGTLSSVPVSRVEGPLYMYGTNGWEVVTVGLCSIPLQRHSEQCRARVAEVMGELGKVKLTGVPARYLPSNGT